MSAGLSNMQGVKDMVANENWAAMESFFNQSPQLSHTGFKVDLSDIDAPLCEISEIQPYHLGGLGTNFINGAISSAMIDLAIGITGLKFLSEGGFATTSLNIDLAKPIEAKRFYCRSRVKERVRKRLFVEATIYNHKDEPCVMASGTVKVGLKKS